jgi:hypothetical protein
MDPYLENAELWTGVHAALIARIQDQLAQTLFPRYAVNFEERVYVITPDDPAYRMIYPDVHVAGPHAASVAAPAAGLAIAEPIPVIEQLDINVHERRLELYDPTNGSVVTVIEVLSPTNKVSGSQGRADFIAKRNQVYASTAQWMEIDLLRGGVRTASRSPAAGTEYQAFVSKFDPLTNSRRGHLWPISIRRPLPVLGVPLQPGEPDAPLDLQSVFDLTYQRAMYGYRLNYAGDPPPPTMPADTLAWCRERIAANQSSSD